MLSFFSKFVDFKTAFFISPTFWILSLFFLFFCICTNRLGTCQRASCECDLELAKSLHQRLRARTEDYNIDYHLFYGRFDRGVQCQRSVEGDGPLDACCRKPGGYATAYHSTRQECCSDGSVMPTGTCGI